MTAVADPFLTPDSPAGPAPRSRLVAVLAVVVTLVLAAVAALLLLRRPEPLAFTPVAGWERIANDSKTSVDAKSAARSLDMPHIDGFQRARTEVWSTPDGPNLRSAVLFVVDLDSAGDAQVAYDAAVRASMTKRERIDTPQGYAGFRLDRTELIGEGHELIFLRDDLLYVVSVTSPRGDDSPAEALRIAQAQTGD